MRKHPATFCLRAQLGMIHP